ncbi:hypothetical protein [Sinorhizobium meliloti]|nr:hypothetical protein [Sinorhizobium meliloti]
MKTAGEWPQATISPSLRQFRLKANASRSLGVAFETVVPLGIVDLTRE